MATKRHETGYVALVRDMDRTCYICDKENKVCIESGHKFKAMDEFCLVCDQDGLKTIVRGCVRDKAKFKLMLPEKKRAALLMVMQQALNDEEKAAVDKAAKMSVRQEPRVVEFMSITEEVKA